MSHNYLSNPNSALFSLENDVDDDEFLKGGHSFNSRPVEYKHTSNNRSSDDYEIKKQQLLEARKVIEERTIQSSKRSLSYLRESEDIGISTAEELIRQREQLDRVDNHLDNINSTLRFSQKHIQNIKSIFGGLKSYLSGGNKSDQLPSTSTVKLSNGSLPTSPVESLAASNTSSDLKNAINNFEVTSDNTTEFRKSNSSSQTNMNVVLEKNLNEMNGSLARLKGLAIGLSSEIDSQNELLDNIVNKSDRAQIMLEKQDKDVRKLLKK